MARIRRPLSPAGRKMMIVFGFILIAAGIFLMISGIANADRLEKQYKACTATTEGIVTDVKTKRTTSKTGKRRTTKTTYYNVYDYEVDGVKYNDTEQYGSSKQTHSIGDKITVHYDPNEPAVNFTKDNSSSMKAGSIAAGCMLIFGGLMMVILLFIAPKIKMRTQEANMYENNN